MTTNIELANAVKKLRDYIANSSLDGSEAAEAYENILEFADATMKPYGLLPQKFLTYPPYTPISDDEDDEDDEDEEEEDDEDEEEEEEDLEENLEELLNQKKYEDNKAILKLKKKFKAHKEQDALDWEHKQYEYEDEIEDLKNKVAELKQEVEHLKSQRPKHTCPQDEDLTGGDANYEYYYTNTDDGEMTIWKVPRHLAEIKSSTPYNWDNAVAECFRDEKFGEDWDKLNYLIVREMKLKDLVKRKWKPKSEKDAEEEDKQ